MDAIPLEPCYADADADAEWLSHITTLSGDVVASVQLVPRKDVVPTYHASLWAAAPAMLITLRQIHAFAVGARNAIEDNDKALALAMVEEAIRSTETARTEALDRYRSAI